MAATYILVGGGFIIKSVVGPNRANRDVCERQSGTYGWMEVFQCIPMSACMDGMYVSLGIGLYVLGYIQSRIMR